MKEAEELEQLLRDIEPSGYQRIVLPTGYVIPGNDLRPLANLVFPERLDGKTVMDVGCYYGYFLHNAVERGATRAVGLEPDPDRFRIASAIAPLWGNCIEIFPETIEKLTHDEQFDVVICMRVLHHVADPIRLVTALADRCRGTLVMLFREPHNIQFVSERFRGDASRRTVWARVRARLQMRMLRWLSRDLGIIGVGSAAYHRTYYFNKGAFRSSFLVHNPLFEKISFRPTNMPGLALAVCECRQSTAPRTSETAACMDSRK